LCHHFRNPAAGAPQRHPPAGIRRVATNLAGMLPLRPGDGRHAGRRGTRSWPHFEEPNR
jgi:hypothetical protein